MAATVAQLSPVPAVGQEYSLKSCANMENGAAASSDNNTEHQKVPPRHQQLSPRDFKLVRTLGTGIRCNPHIRILHMACVWSNCPTIQQARLREYV